jgi:2-keto-3-deoxy-L-rhamnonate aldolase RhmA
MGWIPRYLDAGADGIVLAMTESAADAERAIRLARYQPHGSRSYGGGSRNGVGEPAGGAVNPGACTPEVIVMIETPGAMAELKQIVATPGLGGAWVGPVDLGLGLDRPYPLPPDDPAWRKALAQVVSACLDAGIRPGMFAVGGEDAREWLATGFQDVVLSSDIALLRRAFDEHLARSRTPVTQADPLCHNELTDPYAGR